MQPNNSKSILSRISFIWQPPQSLQLLICTVVSRKLHVSLAYPGEIHIVVGTERKADVQRQTAYGLTILSSII